MSELRRYVLVDRDDVPGDWEYDNFDEAQRAAWQRGQAVLERTYTWEDDALIWTPDGSETWPPQPEPCIDCGYPCPDPEAGCEWCSAVDCGCPRCGAKVESSYDADPATPHSLLCSAVCGWSGLERFW